MRHDALERWLTVALAAGHRIETQMSNVAVMTTRSMPRPVNNTGWGIGVLVLAVLGFLTLGLAWVLILPYLVVWGIVAARRSMHPSNRVVRYTLMTDEDGWIITDPPEIAADLIDAAIAQGRLNKERLQ